MSLDTDDEILQDFLVEAGEILELLSEQLVDLETRPDDSDLLNAIFRGFHTVKGGAGFLALTNLVNVCHVAENVFDLLRQGKRCVDSDLMDVVLKTLDTVNEMFAEIRGGEMPSPAEQELLDQLGVLAQEGGVLETSEAAAGAEPEAAPEPESEPEVIKEPEPAPVASEESNPEKESSEGGDDEITDEEFEQFLDKLATDKDSGDTDKKESEVEKKEEKTGVAGADDDISEEEFEAFLDELSKEKTDDKPKAEEPKKEEAQESPKPKDDAKSESGSDDDITEDEFEALLDELSTKNTPAPPPESKEQAKEQPKEEPTPKIEQPKPAAAMPEPAKPATSPAALPAAKPAAQPAAKKVERPGGKEPTAETTVRVDTSRLDEIMNMVGELVLVRNRLVKLRSESSDENIAKAVGNLDVVTGDLQMAVMKTRMQPIKKVFGRFPRVVRDLARSLKKEVSLEMEGEETDLDKNLVEALSDPLVHLVRNSVDHGVESPEDRIASGKPKMGKILLAAEQAGDHILLSITDDGKGMDAEVLRQKAVEKGLFDQEAAERLDEKECFNLIFNPGFSTKTEISDISGRGVGMDVVKTKITQLNGTIDIDSRKGEGSKISIKVPLTLAILPTLMVIVGDQTFALPLSSVNEIFHLDLRKTNVVDGQTVISVRNKALPLFYLKSWLAPNLPSDPDENEFEGHVVIVTVGTQRIGFVVDGLLGQEEVVIKALGEMLHGTPGMAGATITGDGKIAMILDIPSLLDFYAVKSKIAV